MLEYTIYQINETSIYSKIYGKEISYEDIAKANNIEVPFNVKKRVACINIDKNGELESIEYFGKTRNNNQDRADCWNFAKKIVSFVQYADTLNYEGGQNG